MKEEHIQLKERLDKLDSFIDSEKFEELESRPQGLLVAQRRAMKRYESVLRTRIQESAK